MNIKDHIRGIPDFPKPGILFYDISTLLAHPGAWRETVHQLTRVIGEQKPDLLVGIESRGFLVAAPLALALGCGFVMVRKKGKLPGPTIPYTYDLEYGSDTIEIQGSESSSSMISWRRAARSTPPSVCRARSAAMLSGLPASSSLPSSAVARTWTCRSTPSWLTTTDLLPRRCNRAPAGCDGIRTRNKNPHMAASHHGLVEFS